jgi:sorbitol-specific phosphotransferase system component IIC
MKKSKQATPNAQAAQNYMGLFYGAAVVQLVGFVMGAHPLLMIAMTVTMAFTATASDSKLRDIIEHQRAAIAEHQRDRLHNRR